MMHEIYENVAEEKGWSTNPQSRVPFEKLKKEAPENFETMIETCKRVISSMGLIRVLNMNQLYEEIDYQQIVIHAG